MGNNKDTYRKWAQSDRGRAMKNANNRRYYSTEKGRAERRKQARARLERAKDFVRAAKSNPCEDCGNQYPLCCMDMHHARGVKKFNLSRPSSFTTMKGLFEELEKCDLLCANCHRLRHHRDGCKCEQSWVKK